MSFKTLSAWLRRQTKSFRADEGGNLLITFALSTVPIVGFIGAAVDYSRANSVKAAMQAAVNSTALMLSKDAQKLSTAEISQKANDYFNALFNRTEAINVVVNPIFTSPQDGSFRLDVRATARVPTTFTKVFGQSKLNVDVKSEALWGIKKLEVALALDNTGSMSRISKMTNLKTAAHNLLTTLKKRRQDRWRRQGRDRPLRHDRQSRHQLQEQQLVRIRQPRMRLQVLHQHQLEELLGRLRARPHVSLRHAGRSADHLQQLLPGLRLWVARPS